MSERSNSTFGPFAIGVAVGAALALLFAPEAGEGLRDQLGERLRSLRDLALEKAGELGGLLDDAADEDEEPEPTPPRRIAATSSATRAPRSARTPRKPQRRARRTPADA
ncbi:MAG TPA: YtxH domain-containing protein [Gemmatimonadales bacterium]|nr:YtxH domain-containing protein [Gemmatimonadales bacterium]